MKLIVYGESIECSKAVKGSDFVKLYDSSDCIIASFGGISDFSGYSLCGGEWSNPEQTDKDKISNLEQENKLLKEQVAALSDQNDFQEELIVELANIVYA